VAGVAGGRGREQRLTKSDQKRRPLNGSNHKVNLLSTVSSTDIFQFVPHSKVQQARYFVGVVGRTRRRTASDLIGHTRG
jgi:hypothetical protein